MTPTSSNQGGNRLVELTGRHTSLRLPEILRQLELGHSASAEADDNLMADAAEIIGHFRDRADCERRSNIGLMTLLAKARAERDAALKARASSHE